MLKEIDGKIYELKEVKQSDYLIDSLMRNTEEYERILKEIYDLENTIQEQEKAVNSIEYTADYDVINQKDSEGKPLNTNETKRNLAKNEILSKNDVYRDAMKELLNNRNVLKLKQNRIKSIEFQTGTYKRILEYRSRGE